MSDQEKQTEKRWVCGRCGNKFGTKRPIAAAITYTTCDFCLQTKGCAPAETYGLGEKEKKS